MSAGSATSPKDNPGVIAPPPLIYGAALILGLLLHRIFPAVLLPFPWNLAFGLPLMAMSALLAWSAFRAMRLAGTNVDPAKPATALVVDGPFRFTRNPLYLSLTLQYAGLTFVLNAVWVLALLPVVLAVIRYGVIAREERYLEGKFGEEYRRYKATVRRWV